MVDFNFEVGGKWKYIMKGPGNMEFPVTGTFETIDSPNKVVCKDGWDDEPSVPGMTPGMSFSVDFEKIDDNNTKLTLTLHLQTAEHKSMWEQSGAVQGYESAMAKLEEIVENT